MSDPTLVSTHLRQALTDAAACAKAKYHAEVVRIERGLVLAQDGHVTLLADQHIAIVRSQARPGVEYIVNGSCSCHDFSRAPGGKCKHRYGYWLMRRAKELLKRRYNATYFHFDGETLQGIAEQRDDGIYFCPDDTTGYMPRWARVGKQHVAMGENLALGEAQENTAPILEQAASPQYPTKKEAMAEYAARKIAHAHQRYEAR